MQYAFYAINIQAVNKLEEVMKKYNTCIRRIFDKTENNRIVAIKEKDTYQEVIERLLKEQIYIGSMSEKEYEAYAKSYIHTQLIKQEELYEISAKIDDETQMLYGLIKQVLINNCSLYIWVR